MPIPATPIPCQHRFTLLLQSGLCQVQAIRQHRITQPFNSINEVKGIAGGEIHNHSLVRKISRHPSDVRHATQEPLDWRGNRPHTEYQGLALTTVSRRYGLKYSPQNRGAGQLNALDQAAAAESSSCLGSRPRDIIGYAAPAVGRAS